MAEEAVIVINPTKTSELEFEVMIQGIDAALPTVRFVIEDAMGGGHFTFPCTKIKDEKTKWSAKLPALKFIDKESIKFHVEVIIDEYYFEPAQGKIDFVNSPVVNFKESKGARPTVTASFTVKQEEDPIEERFATAGGGETTGQTAPSPVLNVPEEDPSFELNMKNRTPVEDEYIDLARLELDDDIDDIASEVIPGQGVQYPEKEKPAFDAKQVAEGIIRSTVGKNPIKTPEKRGSLFARSANGKAIVKGLEDPETKRLREEKAQRVKDILHPTSPAPSSVDSE